MAENALRERRRRQTEREIGDAALQLFEDNGIDGTTVDDIASAAGISARTFFRYFATKERAALVPHVELDERVEAMLEALDGDRPLLPQLEAIWRDVLADFDNGRSESGLLLLRVRRLMRFEPGLRLASLAVDEERGGALVVRLRELLGADDDLEARVIVETSGVAVRVALDRWVVARDRAQAVDLVETYVATCRLLRGVTTE